MGFGKSGQGVIITDIDDITLGTLGSNTVVKQDAPLGITEDFRMIKMELVAILKAATANEGPITLYLADDELAVAEIAQAIDGAGPIDRNDRVAMEQATRPVFLLGTFAGDASIDGKLKGADGQDGVVNKTVRWTFSNPEGWAICAHNRSGTTLTTGGIVKLSVKYFGVWLS